MPSKPSLRTELRTFPAAAWVLFGGSFLNRFGSFVVPFLVLYLTRRGFSTAQAGLALGSYGVGLFFATVMGGALADRLGRKETIILSMVSSAVAMLALSQATLFPLIVALSFAAGLTSELYRPASSALVADLVPPEHRVTAYAVYRLAINAGFAAGPATAGFLADHSFLLLFAGDALSSLLFALVAIFALPRRRSEHHADSGWRPALRSAFANRPFIAFLVAGVFVTTVQFQMSSTLPLHIRDSGYSSSTFGWLISINGVIIIVTELALTRWTKHWQRVPTIALGWFLICAGFALTAFARTIPALIGTVVIWTIGEMICAPLTTTLVADTAPAELRGRYMGMFGMTWSIGMMLGPPLGTLLYGYRPNLVWLACAICGVLAASVMMTAGNVRPKSVA